MSCQEEIRQSIHDLGLRMTRQREAVLEALHHAKGASTAQEILRMAKGFQPTLETTTAYRTLELFERFGLIASYQDEKDRRRYIFTNHHGRQPRMICRTCGSSVPLGKASLIKAINATPHTSKWRMDWEGVVLTGTCPACRINNGGRIQHPPKDR
jgi:Fur family transcriptional regulator, ferric uptake regulator